MLGYWWRGRINWGDRLAPLLLEYFSDLSVVWAPPPQAEIICVGSILEHMPRDWTGTIMGAGKLHSAPISIKNAKVLALRGPLSAKDFRGSYALGDPGLLADELVAVDEKLYDLGIVPHWSDRELALDPLLLKYNHVIIDPRDEPLSVVKTIGQCKKIVSSSLHGIILADAFAIPRRFEYTQRFDREGGLFKYQDYSLAINTPADVGKTRQANRVGVDSRKNELVDAFRAI